MKKRVFPIVLFLALLLVLILPAKAVTITIQTSQDAQEDRTVYTYYRFLNATQSGTNYAYTIPSTNEALKEALVAITITREGKQYRVFDATLSGNRQEYIIASDLNRNQLTEDDRKQIATGLLNIKEEALETGTFSRNAVKGDAVSADLPAGYYLIESSLGTALVLDTWSEATITEKNAYPTVTKKINTKDSDSAKIGDEFDYELTVNIPNTANKAITVYDTVSNMVKIKTETAKMNSTKAGSTEKYVSLQQDDTYTEGGSSRYKVTIDADTVKENAGQMLTITYKAVIKESAAMNTNFVNSAYVEYDNYKSVNSSVSVKTFEFTLLKKDYTNNSPLSGVEFTLKDQNDKYYKLGTDSASDVEARFQSTENKVLTGTDGKIKFEGLSAGTYTLTETNTLPGYRLLTDIVTITINDNGVVQSVAGPDTSLSVTGEVVVANRTGVELPATGGAGLYIVAGVAIVALLGLGGTAMLKRKVNGED